MTIPFGVSVEEGFANFKAMAGEENPIILLGGKVDGLEIGSFGILSVTVEVDKVRYKISRGENEENGLNWEKLE